MKLDLKTGTFVDSETLINKQTKNELLVSKDKIDKLYEIKMFDDRRKKRTNTWDFYRNLLNKYELVEENEQGKKTKISRAYFKLKEIMLDNEKKFKKLKTVATLAEGPGGFIEFLTDFYKGIKVHAITLQYDQDKYDRNWKNKILENKNLNITYGNLYNKEVIEQFATTTGKVDLVTADGGFQAGDENEKEREHLKLFLAETLTAFRVLRKGGSYILKIYDIFSRSTLELLFLLSGTFDSVELNKPVTSRPANSERYVVCHGFKGFESDIHVSEGDEYYTSILSMSKNEKDDFEIYIKNLEIKNEKFVRYSINTIKEVINFYKEKRQSKTAFLDKEKERSFYKEVWKKEYERVDRKEKRKKKREQKLDLIVETPFVHPDRQALF